MFDAIESTDAARASYVPAQESASIAAHAYHVLYALRGANTLQGMPEPEGGWDSTWSRQAVDDGEWNELRASIRSEYSSFMRWFRNCDEWQDEAAVSGALAVLPHMAFHLGAIRQLLKLGPS